MLDRCLRAETRSLMVAGYVYQNFPVGCLHVFGLEHGVPGNAFGQVGPVLDAGPPPGLY